MANSLITDLAGRVLFLALTPFLIVLTSVMILAAAVEVVLFGVKQ